MRPVPVCVALVCMLLAACSAPPAPPAADSSPPPSAPPAAPREEVTMDLSSPAFAPNARIPTRYTCVGEDISPPLAIGVLPEGARSLALIMDDPDAPAGTWVHWVEWNIPPATLIPEGAGKLGVQGTNSWGKKGYGGPCPPSGSHRYFFKLFALDTALPLPEGSQKPALVAAMAGHILGQAELKGTYSKSY